MEQSNFNFSARYPYEAGFSKNSDTSKEAAQKLTGKDALYEIILDLLRTVKKGFTVDEAKVLIEDRAKKEYDRSTIAARFTELKAIGKIQETPETRKTPRGRNAHVYKIAY